MGPIWALKDCKINHTSVAPEFQAGAGINTNAQYGFSATF